MPLTDEHLAAIRYAAAPLAPDRRQAFVDQVTAALELVTQLGPGVLHRVIAAAQRSLFDPPSINGRPAFRPGRPEAGAMPWVAARLLPAPRGAGAALPRARRVFDLLAALPRTPPGARPQDRSDAAAVPRLLLRRHRAAMVQRPLGAWSRRSSWTATPLPRCRMP